LVTNKEWRRMRAGEQPPLLWNYHHAPHSDTIVKEVISQGLADVNERHLSHTLLMHYAANGNADMARFVIDHKADVTVKAIKERTAMFYALDAHKIECIGLLVGAGDSYAKWHSDARCHEFVASLLQRVERCRLTSASILAPVMRRILPRDLREMLARALWETRFEENWRE